MSDHHADAEKLVLHPTKAKGLGFLAISIVLCAGGIWMIQTGRPLGWFPAVVFALGIPVFGINLLPSASKLTLTPEGFAPTSLFRTQPVTPWSHVIQFVPAVVGGNSTVGWDYVEAHRPPGRAPAMSKSLNGCEAALPLERYGMTAQQLALLMEEWRLRHGVTAADYEA
ncbi:MAG TPA: hypothetical protein VLE43_06865 [Candidatus Saccharimonadia bacterium]|nr:hypothetical protein [Candidatus Saccharimonadia bacterium]